MPSEPSEAPDPSPARSAPVRVGVVGCGVISDAYLAGMGTFPILDVIAVADLDADRARSKAEAHAVPQVLAVEALLEADDVELVVNLTPPKAHADVTGRALRAGKHVYSEKPLATNREDGFELVALADAYGLRLGCAPDTFLGGGIQTCRELIDAGAIGEPLSASAFLAGRGVETWHPEPFAFFKPGGGPLHDMGPYYLSTLVSLLGPVAAVAGSVATGVPERIISSEPHAGTKILAETPTHITTLLEFASGRTGTLVMSSDVWFSQASERIEIHGSEGTLVVPDPNTFAGPVRLRQTDETSWREVPVVRPWTGEQRGIGAADLAHALRSGRHHRASGDLAYHVLDIIQTVHEAADARRTLDVTSRASRPEALPADLAPDAIDG